MSKSVPQLTEKTSLEDGDYFHIVRSNVDYKIKSSNVKGSYNLVVKSSITAAQIKTGNSVPILLVSAPGTGYAIQPLSVVGKFTWNSVAFTSSDIIVYVDTSNSESFQASSILDSGANFFSTIAPSHGGSGNINIVENKGLYFKADADSAVGDGTLILYITYRIITL